MFKLYPRLAVQNLRKNYRITVPYLLSGSGIIMMYYMLYSLTIGTSQSQFYGVTSAGTALGLGIYIIAIFGAIFLFYTNSFLMKRRKKELGLYNILGMEKRHIAGVILCETIITALVCLGLGILLGMIFSKVFFLILEMLLGGSTPVPFVIPIQGIIDAAVIFGCIFLATAFYNILQVRLSKPIELLHGSDAGEREPKAHWLLAIIGLGLLGGGYYMAVTIQDPITAMVMFFVAVILVILGTYLLFIAGITAMLKLLKKNKRFYYKTRHFTAVSGMLYRMKQNAAGLASICILFTCLLVTVSTTFCLYTGIDGIVQDRCARELNFSFTGLQDEEMENIRQKAQEVCAAHGVEQENLLDYRAWDMGSVRDGDSFRLKDSTSYGTIYAYFKVFALEDYNSFAGTSYSLEPGKALLYDPAGKFDGGSISIFGKSYEVEEIEDMPATDASPYDAYENIQIYGLVLNDPEVMDGSCLRSLEEDVDENYAQLYSTAAYSFDITSHDPADIQAVFDEFLNFAISNKADWQSYINGDEISYSYNNSVSVREDMTGLYGGIFFLGLFMGAMFLLGTVLIMYYKQVSEGYEDARRFDIMQKVGMSHQEVKKSIHSQVLMVFFLPLLTALVHLCFAFPMLQKILSLMQMVNFKLILLSMAGAVLVFSAVYLLIYLLTARTYYRIVKSAN